MQFDGNVGGLKEKSELGGDFGEHGEHGKFNCYAKEQLLQQFLMLQLIKN